MASLVKSCCGRVPQRWILVFMGFLGFLNAYGMRNTLSIALTQMVPESKNHTDDTRVNIFAFNSTEFKAETFNWTEKEQGLLISSFHFGYMITQIPAGMLAEKFSAKYTLGLGILVAAILNTVTPFAIRLGGLTTFIAARLIMGLCSGVIYPAANVMLSCWIPLEERSRAGTLVFSGAPLGTMLANFVSGLLLEYSSIGWPSVFYFFGISGIVWTVFFLALCYDTPQSHPFVSDAEVQFLKEKLSKTKHEKPPPPPWSLMLTSKPVWALIVALAGQNWAILTLQSDLNKYISSVLKLSVEDNGYLSSLSYFSAYVFSIAVSVLSDWLIASRRMSTTNVRKMGITLASIPPAIFFLAACWAETNKNIVMPMIVLATAFLGCSIGSVNVNVLDLSPNYAGTLMALKNDLAFAFGLFSPIVVGFLTPEQTVEQWCHVFWVIVAVLLASNLVHQLYASGEVQKWNDPEFLKNRGKPIKESVELLPVTSIVTETPGAE